MSMSKTGLLASFFGGVLGAFAFSAVAKLVSRRGDCGCATSDRLEAVAAWNESRTALLDLENQLAGMQSRIRQLESASSERLEVPRGANGLAAAGSSTVEPLAMTVPSAELDRLVLEHATQLVRSFAIATARANVLPQSGTVLYEHVDEIEAVIVEFHDRMWEINRRELSERPSLADSFGPEYRTAFDVARKKLLLIPGVDHNVAERMLLGICPEPLRMRVK